MLYRTLRFLFPRTTARIHEEGRQRGIAGWVMDSVDYKEHHTELPDGVKFLSEEFDFGNAVGHCIQVVAGGQLYRNAVQVLGVRSKRESQKEARKHLFHSFFIQCDRWDKARKMVERKLPK